VRSRDIAVPDTSAALSALDVAQNFCSAAMVNHCRRSYYWAMSLAAIEGIEVDVELLYVAAMVHDIGLSAEFDNHALPFEVAGGHVGWVLAAGAGWPTARRIRVAHIVERHMSDAFTPADDPESYLLARATSLDISGMDAAAWPAEFRAEVVAAIPRLSLADEFVRCFKDQAARKPASSAAASLASGLADRMAANPLEIGVPPVTSG
jgi:hypothetical protein